MKKKRLLAWALTAVMTVGAGPVTALAADAEPEPTLNVTAKKELTSKNEDGTYTITLTVQGGSKTTETENNLPADVVLVIDSSGSMKDKVGVCGGEIEEKDNGKYVCKKCGYDYSPKKSNNTCTEKLNRMFYAKEAAGNFVNGFLTEGSKVKVGLCDFSGTSGDQTDPRTGVGHQSVGLTDNKAELENAIKAISVDHGDGTSYGAGLREAEEILSDSQNQKFIVFLSDGEPNRGDGKEEAQALISEGVTIMTVGIDVQGNMARYLKAISSKDKNGKEYYYEAASGALTEILSTIKSTITDTIYAGTDATLTDIINTDDFEYDSLQQTGTSASMIDNTITWNIGNLTGEKQQISFKVKLKEGKTGQLFTNDNVKLVYKDTNGNEPTLGRDDIGHPFIAIKKVTFKIVNGTWADGSAADKTVYVDLMKNGTWSVDGEGTLTDIPEGMVAAPGFSGGDWDVTPTSHVSGVENAIYTYTFAPRDLTKVEYVVEHYIANEDGTYPAVPADTEILTGIVNAPVKATPKTTDKYADYCVNPQAEGYLNKGTVLAVDAEGYPLTLRLYYDKDVVGGEDGGSDQIPDKYQKKVTFKVVNGTWADGTTVDKITYVTLFDANGNWDKNGSGELKNIPTGMKANTNYGNGKWDTTPPTTVSGTADAAYTYNFSKTTSGGGGGGSHSHRNTTKTEPKQEEVLNKEDHFQYVQGYPDATVRPDANITRAEATVIFFRLLTDSVREKYLDTENSFTDVNTADWFNLGISTMENGGFVNGYKDGSFRPNGYITRAELATIISNFDDLEPVEESKFPDAAGHWAEAYINSAAEKGWLSGYADGLFRPNQLITRAETMSMINRVLERSVDADGLHADAKQWQDNPVGKWYYYAVLEATNPHEYERKDTTDVERWTAITAEKIWEN